MAQVEMAAANAMSAVNRAEAEVGAAASAGGIAAAGSYAEMVDRLRADVLTDKRGYFDGLLKKEKGAHESGSFESTDGGSDEEEGRVRSVDGEDDHRNSPSRQSGLEGLDVSDIYTHAKGDGRNGCYGGDGPVRGTKEVTDDMLQWLTEADVRRLADAQRVEQARESGEMGGQRADGGNNNGRGYTDDGGAGGAGGAGST
jgi:hypothetical protein